MRGADREVVSALLAWQAQGHAAALATVVSTFGSSPRPVGSLAAIRDDGAVIGSVSGGCIEQDLIERVRRALPVKPQRLCYGGNTDDHARWSLPCGGRLELILEPAPAKALLADLLGALEARQAIARELDLENGTSTLLAADADATLACDARTLVTPHGPQLRLLLIGAVQTARYLAELAQSLDYEVLVCDPREEYRNTWPSDACALLAGMPDDAVQAVRPDARTAIVALTHDPKLDDMALMAALRSSAFYVGALGSQRSQRARRERLALLDLAPEHIARLRGPVGLPIGSRTPPEIAVAIAADLIAARKGIALRQA